MSGVDEFFQELRKLMDDLSSQAAVNGSLRKFAVGTTTAPNFQYMDLCSACLIFPS